MSHSKGVHTLKLEVEQTRDELATTLDDIFATFNPRVQFRSHPVLVAMVALALIGGAAALLYRNTTRGR